MRSLADVKVPPNFRVFVLHEKQALPGMQIAVYDTADLYADGAGKPFLRIFTGSDGGVQINDLSPGRYIVQTEGPGQGDAVFAIVSDKYEKSDTGILLQWPYSWGDIPKIRTLAGEIASNDPWSPFENIHLELWTAGSALPLAVQDTGPQGRFRFNETQPGIYILRIHGKQKRNLGDQIEGEIPVELSLSAQDALASFSPRLAMSTCGIQYGICPSNEMPIATASRRLQVLHVPGMAEYPTIAGARYKLLNDRGVSIAEGITDKNGVAELPADVTGRSTLVVAADPLSSTLQQPLDLLAPQKGTPDLAVTLRQIEKCSTVSLEKHAPQK
jgi:hypothetical protein